MGESSRGGIEAGDGSPTFNLPAPIRPFVGRSRELDELTELVKPSGDAARGLAIHGPPSVGKTALVLQWAARVAASGSFPGGIYWLKAKDPNLSAEWVRPEIAGAIGLSGDSDDELAAAVVARIGSCVAPVLVILDDVADWSEELKRPGPLPDGPHVHYVMTTRRCDIGRGAAFRSYSIDRLQVETARELLTALRRPETSSGNAALNVAEDALRGWFFGRIAVHYRHVGRREDALPMMEYAIELHERLAATQPDDYLPVLASSLSNYGNLLSELGRFEGALAACERAVSIREQLPASESEASQAGLAGALDSLGNRLGDLERAHEAVAMSTRAWEIREELAAARPERFLPALAMSLHNLGALLGDLGRYEEGLAKTERAVEIRERLAVERPDRYSAELASSIGNLGIALADLGRFDEAFDAAERALRSLAERFLAAPSAHGGYMRIVLRSYLRRAREVEREPDAGLIETIRAALRSVGQDVLKEDV